MARIFITGSSDGLGLLTAQELIRQGHNVVLHARNEQRAKDTLSKASGAEKVLSADLSVMTETKDLAKAINDLGEFDAVIHNAGVYQVPPAEIFIVNTIAPYMLTSLINPPKRLIYLSSDMHLQGKPNFEEFRVDAKRITYSDSKLHVLLLAKAVARQWPQVYSNAVNPGWVPTKMGGKNAPDDLKKGSETQAWLAVSDDEGVKVSGEYFFHKRLSRYNKLADDMQLQDELLKRCAEVAGVELS